MHCSSWTGNSHSPSFISNLLTTDVLDNVGTSSWVVLLDSNIFLPRSFRKRIEGLPLQHNCIYGLSGRRICWDLPTFHALRHHAVWDYDTHPNPQPFNSFLLFHSGAQPNWLPSSLVRNKQAFEEAAFIDLFPHLDRHLLPLNALELRILHFGTFNFRAPDTQPNWTDSGPPSYHVAFEDLLIAQKRSDLRIAMTAYFPGCVPPSLTSFVTTIYPIASHHLYDETADHITAADQLTLRNMLSDNFPGVSADVLLASDERAFETIPNNSLDILYINGGVSSICPYLIRTLPQWIAKLRANAIICGDSFAYPVWQHGVTAISWLIGTPEHFHPSGFWWTNLPIALRSNHQTSSKYAGSDDAIFIISRRIQNDDALFLSIHSVRAFWDGPIIVIHHSEPSDPVRLACWRFGCTLRASPPPTPDATFPVTMNEYIHGLQFFRRALILFSGTLALASLRPAFIQSSHIAEQLPGMPCLLDISSGCSFSLPPDVVSHCSAPKTTSLLVCNGEAEDWSEVAWTAWTKATLALHNDISRGIRVRPDATVVIIADLDAFAQLQHQWAAMVFPESTSVLLFVCDLPDVEPWLPGRRLPNQIIQYSRGLIDAPSLLSMIAKHSKTSHIVFLSPLARALPNAELFLEPYWANYELVSHVSNDALIEFQSSGNVFVPLHFSGFLSLETLLHIAGLPELTGWKAESLPLIFRLHASKASNCTTLDLYRYGWLMPSVCQFINRRSLNAFSTPDSYPVS